MNCIVVSDKNWDNIPIMMRRISSIPSEDKLNVFYGKTLNNILKCKPKNYIIRRNTDKLYEFIDIINYCIVFSNLIEYNSNSRLIIDLCELNKIPCFIFSEKDSSIFYNNEFYDTKFSKLLKLVQKKTYPISSRIEILDEISIKTPFSIEKIRDLYQKLKDERPTIQAVL